MNAPFELTLDLPMEVGNNMLSRAGKVWEILSASIRGDIPAVRSLVEECSGLAFAQYIYAPPIHFAVREGHEELVRYLLSLGAHDPTYRTYHYLDSLETMARDRGLENIAVLLEEYAREPARQKYNGDNGRIRYQRTETETEFEMAVLQRDYATVEALLVQNPALVNDRTFCSGEGILAQPANRNERQMVSLLLRFGASVPLVLKWAHAYHFKHFGMAELLLKKGMNPNTQNWHGLTLLHDMAQKGDIPKAELLIRYGADLNPVDRQYQSTPLGIACRFGQTEMVRFLLDRKAEASISGAVWSTPLAWAMRYGHEQITEIINRRSRF